ncbi:unnamed protein product [Schistocephalus solidus]|uniref:Sodium-dependent transporter n=1 Tax=Schistocephalus solidus TaxID=70667 RepID=A0A183T131_SCHSO|nr:unnamed protein product [Schistocephalus solidus]
MARHVKTPQNESRLTVFFQNDESQDAEEEEEEDGAKVKADNVQFSSTISILLSCVGAVVGSGNIWRYPRIAAQNSHSEGAFAFVLVWIFSVFLWAIPVTIIEYAIGRFTRSGPLLAFRKFIGQKLMWIGGWVTMTTFFISGYYSVVVGWCFYYVYYVCSIDALPADEVTSLAVFSHFTEQTYYPVLTHFMAIALAGSCIFGGLKWIEIANSVLVSLLMVIILITFGWALSLQYAELGIQFLLTPNWGSLRDPRLWKDAFIQNAFDTGAGMGLFTAYSAYFRRKNGVVRYGTSMPLFNNLVRSVFYFLSDHLATEKLTCLIQIDYFTMAKSQKRLIYVIRLDASDVFNVNCAFSLRIPVLYSTMGVSGRVLCGLFFLCLSFAGLTTLISNLQLTMLTLKNCRVRHYLAASIALTATFLIGLPSALSIVFLDNQDSVWGFALLISGVLFCLLVIIYGANKFRQKIVNEFGHQDWHLPRIWIVIVVYVCPFYVCVVPVLGTVFVVWNILDNIIGNPSWSSITLTSFLVIPIEWLILLTLLIVLNIIIVKCRLNFFQMDSGQGYDPYSLEEIPPYDGKSVVEFEVELSETCSNDDESITKF